MKTIYKIEYLSPIGFIKIYSDETSIIALTIGSRENNKKYIWDNYEKYVLKNRTPKILEEAKKQIDEYFKGKRKKFELKLKIEGTDFQKKVWNALLEIPYGETRSYKQIAEMIGNPKAFRAVGLANNKNKIGIIIPCHRVIGANGKLVGYASGLENKRFLLDLEKKFK